MNATQLATFLGLEEIIKACFESVVKEAFEELTSSTKTWWQQSKLLTVGRSNYANYISNSVGIFPLFGTSRSTFVDDIYIEVSVTNEIEHEKYKSVEDVKKSLIKQKSGELPGISKSSFLLQALEDTKDGFALLGNPGSGKTTAFRHLTLSAARGIHIRGKLRIPIYLAVRDMSLSQRSIEDAVIRFFEWLDIGDATQVFHGLLKAGNCILFLDGLDETGTKHQIELISELSDLRAKYQKSIFCVSSRPHGLSVGLSGFTKWQTLPLSFMSRIAFVKSWFNSVNPGKGNRLLDKCSNRPEILDLGSSPLLLSIICALYNNDLDIPSDPDELYARCTEGLLGAWDTFRNIARETVIADFSIRKRIILVSWIAASLFEKGKIIFSPKDVQSSECIEKASAMMRQEAPPVEELLKALHNDFGILIERAPGIYSFSHLTLQEYLVSSNIIDNRLEIKLLSSYCRKPEWFEIICMVGKMLPNADEYMRALHYNLKLENVYDMKLLRAVWNIKPICSHETRRILMTNFAAEIANSTKHFLAKEAEYEINESVLTIKIYKPEITSKLQKLKKSAEELQEQDDDNIDEIKMQLSAGALQQLERKRRR